MAKSNNAVMVTDLLRNETGGELAVASAGVAYTETFVCLKNVTYAFEFKFSSGGTVAAKIEIEQGNVPPATEGAASTDYVVPSGAAEFNNAVGNTNTYIKAYAPAATKFLRAKITGLEGNAATTKLVRFNVGTVVNS